MKNYDLNKIEVLGKIKEINNLFENLGEEYIEIVLDVERPLKERIHHDEFFVHLPNIIFNRLNFEVDSKIKINGEIRTYSIMEEEKRHTKIVVFAKNIEKAEVYDKPYCKVSLVGTICKKQDMRSTPNGKRLRDLTIWNHYSEYKNAYIPSIAWEKVADNLEEAEIGTKISTVGVLHSRKYHKKIFNDDGSFTLIEKQVNEYSINSCQLFKE